MAPKKRKSPAIKYTRKKRLPKKTELAKQSAPSPERVTDRPEDILTLQQEMFAQYFTSETEFYGNGVQSYSRAYDEPINQFNYDSIKARAARLLMTPKIINRITTLLKDGGFNDENVDKQLLFLITQKVDFRSALGAIKEYNKMKNRVQDKLQIDAPVAVINILPAKKRPIHAPAQVIREHQDDSSRT